MAPLSFVAQIVAELTGGILPLFVILDPMVSFHRFHDQGASGEDVSKISKRRPVSKDFSSDRDHTIAAPLLAGPGSLTTVMLLARDPYGLLVSSAAILVDWSNNLDPVQNQPKNYEDSQTNKFVDHSVGHGYSHSYNRYLISSFENYCDPPKMK